jgi:hypothetical protein
VVSCWRKQYQLCGNKSELVMGKVQDYGHCCRIEHKETI